MTTSTITTTRRLTLARTSAACGVAAGLLTMLLSFLALALAAVAVTTGIFAIRRAGPTVPVAVGITGGGLALYLIVLEILILGG